MYWQIDRGLTLPVEQETVPVSLPGLPSLGFHEFPSFLASPTTHSAYLAAILEKFHSLDKNDWVGLQLLRRARDSASRSHERTVASGDGRSNGAICLLRPTN
uniref:Uncharacterized protein n=1 Tax=Manihot esculenta TaxID=3983 RepID=A0A2C9VR07_MANES